jgi:p-aminobenzoyl-glutamate transporter AbgT
LAALRSAFAAVASAFNVNMLIKPLDAVLTEWTNDAIHIVNPPLSIEITANLWFSNVSVVVLMIIVALVTERIIEPRLAVCARAGARLLTLRQSAKIAITSVVKMIQTPYPGQGQRQVQ